MLKGFREFISKGNVVDLAVGVIIGAAFGAVVKSFTDDVLMAVIGAIFGKPNFDSLTFTIGDGVVYYGKFLTALVTFVLTAAAVYFVVVVPINKMRKPEADAGPSAEDRMVELLERIASK